MSAINLKVDEIRSTLYNLPLDNAIKTIAAFDSIRSMCYAVDSLFGTIGQEKVIVDKIVEAIRKYEFNGLQLSGNACWVLLKICENGNEDVISLVRNSSVVELLLRISFQQPISSICSHILSLLVFRDMTDDSFRELCETTITIKDELAAPIPAINFISFYDLIRSGIARLSRVALNDSHTSVEAALRALASICPLVDNRRNHIQSGGGGGSGDSIDYNVSNLLESLSVLSCLETDDSLSTALHAAFLDALTGISNLNLSNHPSVILSKARFNGLDLTEFIALVLTTNTSTQIIQSVFRLIGALSWGCSDSDSASLIASRVLSPLVALNSVEQIKASCFSEGNSLSLPRLDVIARGFAAILLSSTSSVPDLPEYAKFTSISLVMKPFVSSFASDFIYCYSDMLQSCFSQLSQPSFSWNRIGCVILGIREICSNPILCQVLINMPSRTSPDLLLLYDILHQVAVVSVAMLGNMAESREALDSVAVLDDNSEGFPQLTQSGTRVRNRRGTSGRYSFQDDGNETGIGACGLEACIIQGLVAVLSAVHGRRRFLVFRSLGEDVNSFCHQQDYSDVMLELHNCGLIPINCLIDFSTSWDEMVPLLLNSNILRLHVTVHALAWFGCGLTHCLVSDGLLVGQEFAHVFAARLKVVEEGDDAKDSCRRAILSVCEVLHEIMSDDRHGVTDRDGMLLVLCDIFSMLFEALEMFKRADDDDDEKRNSMPPRLIDNPSLADTSVPSSKISCSSLSDHYGCHSSFCYPPSCFSKSCFGFHHPQARWRITRPYRQQRGQKTCPYLPTQEFRTSLIDKIGELWHSEWTSCHDYQFALSTTRLVRALSYIDDVPRRSIAKHFARVHDMTRAFLGDVTAATFLLGCIRDMVTPIMHKFSPMEEVLLTDLMLDCLCCHKNIALHLSICEIINCLKDEEHGNFIQRNLSRRETEDKIMQLCVAVSRDPYYRVVLLKTMAIMAEFFYDKPFHVYASWSFPITLRKRRQIREEVGCNMITKSLAAHPYDVLSIAHGLSFATGMYAHAKMCDEKAGINVQSRNTRFVLMSMLNPDDANPKASEGSKPLAAAAGSIEDRAKSEESSSVKTVDTVVSTSALDSDSKDSTGGDDEEDDKAFIDAISGDVDDDNNKSNGVTETSSIDVKPKTSHSPTAGNDLQQTSSKMSSILESINASHNNNNNPPAEIDESEKRNRRNFKIDFGSQLKNSLVAKDTYMDKFTPLIPNALAFLTSNMQVSEDESEAAARMTGIVSRVSTSAIPPSQSSMRTIKAIMTDSDDVSDRAFLEEEEREKEVLALATFKALETFLSDDLANPFERYKEMLGTHSVGQAIPVVMIRFPENVEIQQHGLAVISEYAVHGIDLSLLGESLCQALGVAVFSCPQDRQIHKHFAVIVKHLGALNSASRVRQLFFATETHKWLYIVLQCAWRDVNADACSAVANLISDEDDSGKILGMIGCAELVIRIMLSQTIDYQVQYQGMRALNALCKTPENLISFRHLLRSSGPGNAKSVISHAKKVLRGHHEGADLLKQFSQTLSASTQAPATGNAGKPPCVVS